MLHEIDSTSSVNKTDCSEVASWELLSTIILILCSVPDFLMSTLPSKVSSNSNRYYIEGNRVNLSTDSTTQDFVVSYLSVPLGPEGYPMIKQGHEEAIVNKAKRKLIWRRGSIYSTYAGSSRWNQGGNACIAIIEMSDDDDC